MAATNHTEYLHLPIWEEGNTTDFFELNGAFTTIDSFAKEHNSKIMDEILVTSNAITINAAQKMVFNHVFALQTNAIVIPVLELQNQSAPASVPIALNGSIFIRNSQGNNAVVVNIENTGLSDLNVVYKIHLIKIV